MQCKKYVTAISCSQWFLFILGFFIQDKGFSRKTFCPFTAILPSLKGNSKLAIIRQLNSILNLLILPNS